MSEKFRITKTPNGVLFEIGNQCFTVARTTIESDGDSEHQDFIAKMLAVALQGLQDGTAKDVR